MANKLRTLLVCTALFAVSMCCPAQEPAPSRKRGICFNKITEEQAKIFSKGVSWCYNWHYKADDFLLKEDSPLEFYPMVWGAHEGQIKGFAELLEGGFKAKYVLAVNEPNLKGQAFITPETCSAWHKKIKELADKHSVRTVGPHMAIGSAEDASVKAFDPIEKKDVTYTYMVPYLDAFHHFLGGTDEIEAVAVHSYGNIHELRWAVDSLHKKYGKPIWVTEFACWEAKHGKELEKYMAEAVEFMEKSPHVEKYAWFMADMKDSKLSLLNPETGALTKLGELYISLPAE